ncbi:MAG TPA: ABC transporter permease [Candidatus Baltobacteraceae bacterium]|nr:ABC transporter permease [Candidatus Baltobacteraceae bacterium]
MIEDLATVYAAELARRIRSRPFIVGLVVGVLAIALVGKLPAFLDKQVSSANAVVLIGSATLTARAEPLLAANDRILGSLPLQPIDDAFLKRHGAAAAIELRAAGDGLRVTVFAHDPGSVEPGLLRRELLPLQLELTTQRSAAEVKKISAIPIAIAAVGSKFSSAKQAAAVRAIAYTLIFFLYLLILLNSQLVTASVAEEKTSRIAELLVASVNPAALLSGKILASATLGMVQLAVWIATILFLGAGSGGSQAAASGGGILSLGSVLDVITPGIVVAFFVFFVIGFLQVSTLFAGAASLINRTEDLGSITLPLALPVVAAFFIAIATLQVPDSTLAVVTSYVPLLAPFVMFTRIAVSNVPVWQIAVSIAINLAALYVIAVFAGKIYRVGMLLYGRSPSLRQVWSVIRS